MKIELFEGRVIKPFEHKDLSGTFDLIKVNRRRTKGQNDYLHGYLFPNAAKAFTKNLKLKEINQDVSPELAKEVLISTCGVFYVPALEEHIAFRTSKMSTKQSSEFIERSLRYVAEKTGEYLDEPNEEQWRQIKETE